MAQLISGEAYSLSEIFCGENDKQYCVKLIFNRL